MVGGGDMKKKCFIGALLAIALSTGATAVLADEYIGGSDYVTSSDFNPGFYFGGQLGLANLHYSGSSYTKSDSSYDRGYKFAGRFSTGYAFSQFIATELGYDYYGHPKFKHISGNTQDFVQHGLDLVLKANLPLDYGFSTYVKGGLAWVHRGALHGNWDTFVDKKSNDKVTPVGAIGVSYWFAPNMAIDLSWTKTMSVSDLPTTDLFALGLIYRLNI